MKDLTLINNTDYFVISKEYLTMIERINEVLPEIQKNSDNFYKSSSQFKSVTLDVTDLTPISSLKHILAVIDQTKIALQEAQISYKRKQIELKNKILLLNSTTTEYEKEMLEVDIFELNSHSSNIENSVKGAIRKLSFFVTQYKAILEKLGKEEITEEEYELEESRYHLMTAIKQALVSARSRGGVIDEGNHIYFFDMGINGGAIQKEFAAYFEMEQEMMMKGIEPTHETTMAWITACANKYLDCSRKFAESKGFVVLDKQSLTKELTYVQKNN